MGTVTVSEVVEAEVTVAFVAPKYAVLLEGVVSKLVPVIVTESPTLPDVGLIDEMDSASSTSQRNTFIEAFCG